MARIGYLGVLGFTLLLAVALSVVAIEFPLAIAAIAVLVLGALLSARIGVVATITSLALVLLGLAGSLAIYVPALQLLTQACVLLLMGVGLIGLFRIRLPAFVLIPGAAYLLIASVLSVGPLSASLEFGLRGWIGLVSPALIAIATAYASIPTRHGTRGRTAVLASIAFVVAINSIWALRQGLLGLTSQEMNAAISGESTYAVGDQIRLMGTFATNQDFGVFTACLAPAFLAIGLNRVSHRRVFLALSASVYVVTLLSLTRTALVASVAAGLIVLIFWGRGDVARRVVTVTTVAVLIGGLGVWALSQLDNARVQDSLARAWTLFDLEGDTSFLARLWVTLPRGLSALAVNPWGSAAGAAGPVSQSFPTLAPFGPLTTDNGYLLIGIQTGVFGLAAFVLMLVATLIWLAQSKSAEGRAGAAAITALLVAMILAGYWGLLAPMALVASVVGIGIASRAGEAAAARTLTPTPPTARATGSAVPRERSRVARYT